MHRMNIFKNESGSLSEINEKPFKLEKEIQKLFEANLKLLMNLDVIKSEFSIKNKRIDTLAFDPQTNAFIIIEYKRDKNISVVDQGFSYLSLMLENKADFLVEYNETMGKRIKRSEIDWSQSRVVFVSTHFTENQILATNFKDIAIELWEIKRYDNELIVIQPIKKSTSAESIKPIAEQSDVIRHVSEEIKVYTIEDHYQKGSDFTIELYEKLLANIFNMVDNVNVVPYKYWINLDVGKLTILSIEIQRKKLNLFINMKAGKLDDPKNISRDVSRIGHYGKGDYQIQIDSDANLEYILSLIKQILNQ